MEMGRIAGSRQQQSRRKGQWHDQAGGSGAERDEKEAQCQSLLVDWAGVGQEDSSLSQRFGLSS